MEDYDEVVIKTVRDLFRSYPLIQIKKYMMTKEGEINEKDSELKSLILEKYTSLTHGFNGLENISKNLQSLVDTRKEFTEKMDQIDFSKLELALQNIPFGNELNDIIKDKNNFDFDEINEKIDRYIKEKNHDKSIDEMINFKKYIDNNKNEFNDDDINLKEKYYFLLVELVEGVLNKMIEDSNICSNIEQYKTLLDKINENLIKDKYEECMEYLLMIELYLKISCDKNIRKIMEDYFSFFNNDDKNCFSINILLKILFLKISQILYDISIIPIESLFNDSIVEKYYSIYETVICIKLICDKYCINDNIKNKTDLNKFYSFIKSEIDKNMNSLLIIPKNSFQKLYLYNTINLWNKLFIKNDINEPIVNGLHLIEFLYLDKSIEQISNITTYMLKQYSINNLFNLKLLLKNKNIKNENDIYLSIVELNKIDDKKEYKQKYMSILQNKLNQFFSGINNIVIEEPNDNKNNKQIEYMNIIIQIITSEELLKIFNDFKFNDIIQIIKELIGKNQMNDYLKIKNYINDTFKLELLLELYLDEEQIKKYNENGISESLNQLIETLYEYEIKEKEHKINIYLNIIEVYEQILQNFYSNIENDLKSLNKIFINDIFILYNININIEENQGNKMKSLLELVQNIFNIDIENINKNINDYKNYHILNEFFSSNVYINKKPEFLFDINKYVNNKPKKIEYLPIYSNKMHVHMLNKSKIDYSERENNEISTCYIYDYGIEENYLSIRQDNPIKSENNNIQNSNSNKGENNNMFGNITGKIFNLINDD